MQRAQASSRPWWVPGIAWIYFAVLFFLLCFTAFLWKSGERLTRSDSFGHVRWAVMLGGENNYMTRAKAALALLQEGRYDSLILSGPLLFGTHYESEFSQEFLLSRGFPKDRLFQFPNDASSTQTEAEAIIPQLRRLGIDTVLIITSNFHTARAGRIFERLAGGSPVVKMYSANQPDFDPKSWWTGSESRRIWFIEWLKTLHSGFELIGQKPLTNTSEVLLVPNPRLPANSGKVALPDSMATALTHPDTVLNTGADTSRTKVVNPPAPEKPRTEKSKPSVRHRKRR